MHGARNRSRLQYGRNQFVESVDVLSIGVEGHVVAPGASGDRRKGDRVRAQRARAEVEIPSHDLVGAAVNANDVVHVAVRASRSTRCR